MCGILFCSDPDVSQGAFGDALELLNHRGPDATGYAKVGDCQLGHKRLKILDLDDRSNQPFYSHDGRFVMVFNGEIYNYRDLAREYRIERRTTSDTEVLLELFARFGQECVGWLRGMFAFVILDATTHDVFVARDRLGVKPLFMHREGESLTIASEIAPILQMTGPRPFDEMGIRQYLKLRTFFNGRTAYEGVEMFPAGHYMAANRLRRYWSLPTGEQAPPSDEELRGLVQEAVDERLTADVPVGSYLSGGLDSTIVAGLANRPHTWTVGFPELNEFEWARIAAGHINSLHHEVILERDEFPSLARDMIRQRREPLSVPNEVLLYRMTSQVKKENTVILSGEGADELFFGYDRIFRWAAAADRWNQSEFDRLYSYGTHEDPEIVADAVGPFLSLRRPLDIVAHFFQVAHLHGLLRRLDYATMLCGVEARVPFVDHHPLVERMAGVPFDYRMHDGVVKAPLKRTFAYLVPRPILERRKVGFPVPLDLIDFGVSPDKPPMDRWLDFNLAEVIRTPAGAAEPRGG